MLGKRTNMSVEWALLVGEFKRGIPTYWKREEEENYGGSNRNRTLLMTLRPKGMTTDFKKKQAAWVKNLKGKTGTTPSKGKGRLRKQLLPGDYRKLIQNKKVGCWKGLSRGGEATVGKRGGESQVFSVHYRDLKQPLRGGKCQENPISKWPNRVSERPETKRKIRLLQTKKDVIDLGENLRVCRRKERKKKRRVKGYKKGLQPASQIAGPCWWGRG